MIPQHEMNHLPVPANTICVDGRQWDISNLLLSTCHDNETTNFSQPSTPSTITSSHRSSSLQRSLHNNNEQSSLQSPEMNDEDVKMGTMKNQYCDEDEKEYEKEYYYGAYDDDDILYPTDRPDTPPTVDEIFRRPPQRRNISEFDIQAYSSHSHRSFAIPRGSHESDDDDCSALTFNDDGSAHDSPQLAMPNAIPQSLPVFTPSRPRPMVEVMPDQFLPLRGSDETLFYVEHGFCREARCMYCSTNQYFIQDVTMVMCPGCRLIFAPEAFGSNSNSNNNNNNTVSGSLGLGLRVDEADAIFRHQRQVQRRNRSTPPPAGLQQQFSQTSLISTAVAAASTSAPNEKGTAAAAASTTARNLLMRRQASLSRFRGSQHSKRSTISEGSRAA